jgi:hypothetical protein
MITIVDATLDHARDLAPRLRAGDHTECVDLGVDPLEALEVGVRLSMYSWTALDDGKPCAMWGIRPDDVMGQAARVWLLTGDAVARNRMAFLRHTKAWVARVSDLYPVLYVFPSANYPEALRLLRWLGFDLSPPGPCDRNGALVHRAERGHV